MDARTLAQLEQITRERLDDLGTTRPRWSSESIRRALNEAEREACVRAKLLRDETTDALTQIAVVAGTALYPLARSILEVDGLYDEVTGEPLGETDEASLYRVARNWRAHESVNPRDFVVRVRPNEQLELLLYPKPSVATTLRLQAYRLPRYEMEADDDEPEIAPRHHDGLVEWAVHRCFSVRDPDTYDPVKAGDHLAVFTAQFGERPTADTQRRLRERRRNLVVPRDF